MSAASAVDMCENIPLILNPGSAAILRTSSTAKSVSSARYPILPIPVSTAISPDTIFPAATAASLIALAFDESHTTGVRSCSTITSAYISGVSPRQMISSFAPASLSVIAS